METVVAGLAVFLFAVSCTSRTGPPSASECKKQLDRVDWMRSDSLTTGVQDEMLTNSQLGRAFRQKQANEPTFHALNGFALSGSEREAMVERVKAMSDSERIATIMNSIQVWVSQAKPGTYTAGLGSIWPRVDTIYEVVTPFRRFLLAQAKDFLIQAGKKKADVDRLTDSGVARAFLESIEWSGCKREDTNQNQDQR